MSEEKITNWCLDEIESRIDKKGEAMGEILSDGDSSSSIISSLLIAKASIDKLMAHCMLIMDEHEKLAMKALPICIEMKDKINPLIGAAYAVTLGENLSEVKKKVHSHIDDMDIELTDIDKLSDRLFNGEND